MHNDALRTLAGNAAARLSMPLLVLDAAPELRAGATRAALEALEAMRAARDPHGGLLVHDFAPDPEASAHWLDAVAGAWPALTVLALLGSPADAALHLLVGHPRRFHCADVVLAREITTRALGDRFAEAARTMRHGATVRALATGWPLDAPLLSLARHAFALADDAAHASPASHASQASHASHATNGAAAWPTLDALLRAAGMSRGTFVRHATAAGFRPPLRFLQVLRVLGVAAAVRGGETAASAATRFGYGSADTLRHHFASLTGLTPRDARHIDAAELVARMRGNGAAP